MILSLHRNRVMRGLVVIIGGMVLLDVLIDVLQFGFGHASLGGLQPLFDVGDEGTIPTWFAAVQLLGASALLALIATVEQRCGRGAMPWWVLAVGFLYLSFDEAAEVHEQAGLLLRGIVKRDGIFYFRWVVIAVPLCIALYLLFRGFLRRLPAGTRRGTLLGGALFLGGAVGMEMVSGWLISRGLSGDLGNGLLNGLENALELAGIAVFVGALFAHIEGLEPTPDSTGHPPATAAAHNRVQPIDLRLRPERWGRGLVVAAIAILLATALAVAYRFGPAAGKLGLLTSLLDPTRNRSLPVWGVSMLAALAASLSLFARPGDRTGTAGERVRFGLVLGLVALSVDQAMGFPGHGAPIFPLAALVPGRLASVWQVTGTLLLCVLLLSMFVATRSLRGPIRRTWSASGVLLALGWAGTPLLLSRVAPRNPAAGVIGGAGVAVLLAGLILFVSAVPMVMARGEPILEADPGARVEPLASSGHS